MVIWVKNVQTELMVEIYTKSLVRAIGKSISHENELEPQSKLIKVMQNGLFCKQTAALVVRINNIGQ